MGVLFDFDGVLYPETPREVEMYVQGSVETALHFSFPGTRDEALKLAWDCTREHHESSRVFIERLGLATWAEWLPVFAEKIDYAHLAPNAVLKQKIEALAVPKGILSNAHQVWLHKVIRHIDLHDVFDAEKIVTTDMVEFRGKAGSDVGFRHALDRMGTDASCTVMIEDLPKNLRLAKQLGMKTILVTHGRVHDHVPDWVDHVAPSTLLALSDL